MSLPNPICLIESAWMWLRGMFTVEVPIRGHSYVATTEDAPALVTVLECERCGKTDVIWSLHR